MKPGLRRIFLAWLTFEQGEKLKTFAAAVLYYTGIAYLLGRFRRRGAAILIYHSVSEDGVFRDNAVCRDVFEKQISYLASHYELVPVSRIVDRVRRGEEVPDNWVAITFDDGYRDNATVAAPILERHGTRAAVYATLAPVESRQPFYYDQIESILGRAVQTEARFQLAGRIVTLNLGKEPARRDAVLRLALLMRDQPKDERARTINALAVACGVSVPSCDELYLSTDDLRGLQAAGHEVGSHTMTHPNLAKLAPTDVEREVAISKARLESMLPLPVTGFAYPYGKPKLHVTEAAMKSARDAGYGYALSTKFGRVTRRSDLFALPRIGARDCALVRLKVRLLGINL
jgi:peptidoglycan/xylan/chitin deacetylase (PgdA/CDA1 family)